MKKQFDISIDHAMMVGAKAAFDTCLRWAVAKAIRTGSDEGSATLRISFDVQQTVDKDTGEVMKCPVFKYKAGYSVPMKESLEATIAESSKLVESPEGWKLINGQISMEELMAEEPEYEVIDHEDGDVI